MGRRHGLIQPRAKLRRGNEDIFLAEEIEHARLGKLRQHRRIDPHQVFASDLARRLELL